MYLKEATRFTKPKIAVKGFKLRGEDASKATFEKKIFFGGNKAELFRAMLHNELLCLKMCR